MRPIDHSQSDPKNGNPSFPNINCDTLPDSGEKREDFPASAFKENTIDDFDGLPALKSFTMHGFKDSGSSNNPPDQVSLEDKNKHLAGVPQEQLLFTESMIMDYVTLKGIENRFGVKRQDIPVTIFKELVDNALDHVETLALTSSNHDFIPEIHVQISRYGDGITLQVSNPDITSNFTFERIQSIFNFNNFTSTKRNQYKISRGALGNGLKAILGMSYALATESYNYDSWSPLKITSNKKLYSIQLDVDNINRKDKPVSPYIEAEEGDEENKISVEIDIPIELSIRSEIKIIDELTRTFRDYTILNPHITMDITVHGKLRSFPQVQKIKTDWNNLDSIYHYSYKEFENLILSSGADDMTLYDFVSNSIRLTESSKLKKRDWNIPISEVLDDRTVIDKLYVKLRKLVGPKEKLDLPYDMRIKPRKDAIVKRLSQWGIVVESIRYQSYNGPSNFNSKDVRFPHSFEVAEIKTVNHTTKYEVISGINSTIAKLETMENPDKFSWTSKGTDWVTNMILYILQESCGYSEDQKRFKKSDRIVFMHLVSPRIDWKGYGKAQMDFKPFANLGDIIYNACKGGMRESTRNTVTQRGLLTEFLKQRQLEVQQNPNLIVTDRWTPSDVWYANRPELLNNGIKIAKSTRSNFTALIRVICEEDLHVNMEELGIFAADRAQLYFDGHWYDVGFDDLSSLKLKGTDLIIIEKEGMAETLTPLADKHGLALLFTRGFATKYVRDLSELSKAAGCNVLILSDYDDSGVLLASKLKVPRLGIDPKTLEYFNLKREDVEESYTPKNHLNSIKDLVNEEEFDYLSRKRIEINSVKSKVGTEKLWEWIIYRLKEVFPNRNYNRAIEVPNVVKPDDLKAFYAKFENGIKSRLECKSEKTKHELTDFEGLIDDVPRKRIEIEEEYKDVLKNNLHYQDLMDKLNEVVESHPFFNGSG